jgi:hypothetical protein
MFRLCYNGQQVSGTFTKFEDAVRAQVASGDDYAVTWIQKRDHETGEWFGDLRARFEAVKCRLGI